MYNLLQFIRPYKKQMILGPMFKFIEAVLELMIPTVMILIVDKGIGSKNSVYVYKIGGIMLVMATLGVAAAFCCQYFASVASQGFGTLVRNALFTEIQSFSFSEIDEFGTASLINRITNDVNQLQLAIAMLIRLAVRAPFLCIGGIIMAMYLDLKLSTIMILSLPIFLFAIYLIISNSTPLYGMVQKKLDNISLVLRENLTGVRIIRAFARTSYEKKRFENFNEDLARTSIHVGKITSLMNPVTNMIMNLSVLAILKFGAIGVNDGGMTQGKVMAYINYTTLVLSALIVVANLVAIFTKASASVIRVNEIFEKELSLVDKSNSFKISSIDKSLPIIQFKNVSFAYSSSSEYCIENISFEINRGETVGVIGSTGAGKTTLINLISRFYDPQKGRVLVNGIDVKDYSKLDLRSTIGLVPQKAILFSGTVKDNIKVGFQKASDEEIKRAIKIAQASEFVDKLPLGYNTNISQGGVNLSGGQKQRLTIARAIVKDPEILILDDSSSALDFATDLALRRALKNNKNAMTTIIVSQRITTIENADKVIVLNDGKIVDVGKHDELMKNCDVYKEIFYSQLENEEEYQNEKENIH